ncbi:MAG: Crp/Fnr family transcriptional regulator, partial [Chryseobacterium sp.]|nr:Crp/Fnr family transcriptional regulator [Chryseobacterium sp.]
AIKASTVKIASKKDFYELINSSNENLKLWSSILEDLVLQQIEREKDLLYSSPKIRYERVLKRSPKLFQEIPNKYIANYLRMSPETLSRLKKS